MDHNLIRPLHIMRLVAVRLLWFHISLVSANRLEESVEFESRINKAALYYEGVRLRLYCRQATTDDIEIRSSTQLIVQRSNLKEGFTEIYDFEKTNSTTCALVIKSFTRNDSGVYFCREGDKTKFASVEALYSPSKKGPVCTSNYDSLVIVNNLSLHHINFICTTEQGNPPVLTQLHISVPNSTNNISSIQNICTTHHHPLTSRLFSCRIDDSLENATFVCNVSQQFPPPHTDGYRGSCSIGPIHFSPKFTLSVTPPYERVNEGANVTFTCTTNITGVEIKWINIPKRWKYNVTNGEYSSQLKIYDVKKESSSEITVQCFGTYGIQKSKRNATISFTHNDQVPVGTVLICCFSIMLFIAFLLGMCVWKNKMNVSKSSNIGVSRRKSHENEVISVENELAITSANKCNENEENNLELVKVLSDVEDASGVFFNQVYESASPEACTSELSYPEDQYAVIDKKNSQVM